MRMIAIFSVLFVTALSFQTYAGEPNANHRFAVYYADKAPAERFRSYNLVVLDPSYPFIKSLDEQGKTLLGYLSLGEVPRQSPYFTLLKNKGLLIAENKNWKGSFFVDIRAREWQEIVIEELIPKLLALGFDGVFFDTLDSPLESERRDSKTYKGMSEAAVKLIKGVRLHYPSIKIMVNRAYSILPEMAPLIDMEMGESVFTDYDFSRKTYEKIDPALYRQQIKWLQEAKKINPSLAVYTLDYAAPHDSAFIREIYSVQRANGFTPYVATIGLEEVVDEPGK